MTIASAAKATALAALLAVSAALPAAADDRRCPAATAEAPALTIGQISERLTQQGYRDITRMERDDGCWKVRATDAGGRRVRLTVAPTTGAIVPRTGR